jgi:hypothetical protein
MPVGDDLEAGMTRTLLSLLALVSFTAAAQASCSTANMAGSWTVYDGSEACTVNVNTGGVISGCYAGTVTMTTACKWTVKIGPKTFVGRSETIATTSPLKPNLMVGVRRVSGADDDAFFAFRN